MKKRSVILVMVAVLVIALISGCAGNAASLQQSQEPNTLSEQPNTSEPTASSPEEKPINVAIVHTLTGLGDKNMNDNAYAGLEKAKEDFGITFTSVEPKETSEFETMLMQLASSQEYDLIFSLSVDQKDALEKVARLFPEQKFTAMSYSIAEPNVSSLNLRFEEFVFTSGYLAGLLTMDTSLPQINADNVIGIIYAMDIPVQIAPAVGYIAGAKYANKDVEVLTGVIGDFQNVGKAKEIALLQYGKKADIIQAFAGKAGLGVINAAEEVDKLVFGVAVNQNEIAPNQVIASAINAIDMQVYNEVKALMEGKWQPGLQENGIAQGAFSLAFDGSEVKVSQQLIDQAKEAEAKIVSGELVLPKTFEELDAWIAENCN